MGTIAKKVAFRLLVFFLCEQGRFRECGVDESRWRRGVRDRGGDGRVESAGIRRIVRPPGSRGSSCSNAAQKEEVAIGEGKKRVGKDNENFPH